ncbi:LuxR family transcriptional regulator [[Pantoea] beijingensis]|uniref:LuxR family transcriptional regulator n=1 Tax=[Pantoea] beijingensis TaxID=1324864 RepID=A0A443IFT1_9GAMM|nr:MULTISPECIES: response regulator transcription factor [Erwiniaceae]RWR02923.1 LuxR family transcriptional regulator [[Pantoea] beijingensis]
MQNALVVDDHPFVRASVKMILSQDGIANIYETDNGVDAVAMAREHQCDLMILDIALPKLDGLEVLLRLRELQHDCRVLVLTSQSTEYFALRCMQSGAAGFISKSSEPTELSNAIAAIRSGYTYFPHLSLHKGRLHDNNYSESECIARLSDRELMVLQQLARGFSNKEIGESMLLSNKTISTYKTRLIEKLQVKTLVDLADLARRNRLI